MATAKDWMGLGVSPFVAMRQDMTPNILTAQGGSRASATVIGRTMYLTAFTASNSGAGAVLPGLGGDSGALLGDTFTTNNQIAGGITMYAPAGTSISLGGTLQSGSGGVSLNSHTTCSFYPISASTWIGQQGT
jgi:hypothetical protein